MDPTISVARSLAELQSLRDEWDRLARAQANPFLYFSWHYHWCELFGSSFELWTVVVRKAGVVIAICPWCIRRGTPPFADRKLTWLGYHGVGPTCLEVLVDPDEWTSAKPLLLNKLTSSREFDRWDFRRVAHGGYAAELFLTAPYVSDVPDPSCPVTVLAANSEDYFRSVSKGLRKELKNKHARLAAHGNLSYEHWSAAPDVLRVFPEFVRLNRQRMASKRFTGGFLDPVFTRFHELLIADVADQGLVRLDVLRLDGSPVAATYCLGSGGYLFGYQSGFDPAYDALSPMTVLDGIRLKSLTEEGRVKRYDWGPGPELYKRRFSNHETHYRHIRGAQPTAAGHVWKGLFRTAGRLHSLLTRIRHTFRRGMPSPACRVLEPDRHVRFLIYARVRQGLKRAGGVFKAAPEPALGAARWHAARHVTRATAP